MQEVIYKVHSRLFDGIAQGDMQDMFRCIGYHITNYSKGEIIALEGENLNHVGLILSGSVDMVKEDIWGNKTMLVRTGKAISSNNRSTST